MEAKEIHLAIFKLLLEFYGQSDYKIVAEKFVQVLNAFYTPLPSESTISELSDEGLRKLREDPSLDITKTAFT